MLRRCRQFKQLRIQATQGVVSILVSENAFFPMYVTLPLIPQQLPLLRREYRTGMYPIHLYIVRILSLVPGLMVELLLFTSIIYWLTGLRNSVEAFGFTLLVILLAINGRPLEVVLSRWHLKMYHWQWRTWCLLIVLMTIMSPFLKLGSLPVYIH
ncbi:protein scarlet-like [Nomia melanderi]|uniref:protein scarlet-like n=1 Tax=Nomia melanderi TaxID=2448451 RepID=UPI003FCD73AE